MSQPAPPPDPANVEVLPRVLGPFDAVTLVVGSIIGSGIFLKVSNIDNLVPSFGTIMLVWIVGGIATLCGSLSLAELAAMLPQAGGPYVYLREAYGRVTAFLWGWAEFSIIRTGSLGSLACGTVIYLNKTLTSAEETGLLPSFLADFVPLSHWGQGAFTVLAVLSLTWINAIGVRAAARTQNITTVIKVGFLLVLMLSPLAFGKWSASNLQPIAPPEISLDLFKAFGLAMVAVFWPYDGWINIGPVAEEIREPQRNVPLGLGLGVRHAGLLRGEHRLSPVLAAGAYQALRDGGRRRVCQSARPLRRSARCRGRHDLDVRSAQFESARRAANLFRDGP